MDKSFRERYAPILVTARLNSWDIIKVIVLIVMLFAAVQLQIMWNLPDCPSHESVNFWPFGAKKT